MVGNVQDQVLTHDGQTNKAEVSTGDDPRRSADIDAGQTGATVSPWVPSTQIITGKEQEIARITTEARLYIKRSPLDCGATALVRESTRLTLLCQPS